MKIKFEPFQEHWLAYMILGTLTMFFLWTLAAMWSTPIQKEHYIFSVYTEDDRLVKVKVKSEEYKLIKARQAANRLYFDIRLIINDYYKLAYNSSYMYNSSFIHRL